MNLKQRILQLIKRLTFLGYCSFEIESIVKEAIGSTFVNNLNKSQELAVVQQLELYEQLGQNYLQTYSK
ncbi:hypothetical protein [Sporomusa termitida]|uniref:Uncharacterized protein n=1 Tax=Sporomusa termitida TaxID=2377 RepID=A0A517DV29_9FIRM|nr:hypothetical protein [Sporomusa termitida]QDR81146.1 hypothetical protein SPTER_25190 [Sporomusa termitida]